MSIIVCGINHKTASIALREKVAFAQDKLSLYLNDLMIGEGIQEAVILSTCNRSEMYLNTQDIEQVINWFCRQHRLERAELLPALYIHQGQEAISHIMQVACGLDSLIIGEPQILGQMKEAFSESCAAGTVGPLFNRLFQQVFAIAKQVRTHTAVGACPMSVASAAVRLAKDFLPDFLNSSVVIIGAGETAELVLRHLKSCKVNDITLANRSLEGAVTLASQHNVKAISLTELPAALTNAVLVISATSSPLPVLVKETVQTALSHRPNTPMMLVDLAVPRDIEPEVADIPGVSLYCIDDLKAVVKQTKLGREHAADKAREMIEQKSRDFLSCIKSLDIVSTTIRAYRQQIEEICFAELAKAMRQLERGEHASKVLANFAHAFTNKLLHAPSVQLRQAGFEGRLDILQMAQQLFAIPQPEVEVEI